MTTKSYQRTLYQRKIALSDKLVDLNIIRQKRKTMAIHIMPEGKPVEFRVPLKCPWIEIETFLNSKLDWIRDALVEVAKQPKEPQISFRESDLHYFLGQAYPLRLSEGRGKAKLVNGFLHVSCKKKNDQDLVAQQLDKFYRQVALPVFQERLDICVSKFPLKVSPTGLRLRKMKARWGSCSQKGEICLNTVLVQKPISAIDFVINHELCHLVHFAHNKKFYTLLDQAMPTWREAEKVLSRKDKEYQYSLF